MDEEKIMHKIHPQKKIVHKEKKSAKKKQYTKLIREKKNSAQIKKL